MNTNVLGGTEEVNSRFQSNENTAHTDPEIGREIDLLIFFDSNRRSVDFRKLWTFNNSERRFVGNLSEIRKFVNVTHIRKLSHALINVGVNDIDSKNGTLVYHELKDIVEMLKYPGIKIICSEITSRKDRRDTEVLQFNKLLNGYASSMGNIYVAHHSNLRDETYSNLYDIKHLKENTIP